MDGSRTPWLRQLSRILLALLMVVTGIGHLTFLRQEFQAQVPRWVPLDTDMVVVLSGVAEVALGLGLLAWKRYRLHFGIALAVFFVLVFPGNIAQYINRIDAFSLDTDTKRLVRLFFQPVLVVWALWSSGAWKYLRRQSMTHVNGTEKK